MLWIFVGLLFYIFLRQSASELSSKEMRKSDSSCLYGSFSLNCGSDVIAFDSAQYAYRDGCKGTCCTFDSNDCFVNVTESEYIRRSCSGLTTCTLDFSGARQFCSSVTHEPSYVTVYYYCVPNERIVSICSSRTLSSKGLPLYLTNENYPSVPTGDSTCSCSLEVYNCSSSVYIYIIDADMYFDPSICEQRIEFVDGTNTILKTINCESYYSSAIEFDTLSSNYLNVNFQDNSDEDQEGYMFLGFAASVSNATFGLSCAPQQESWCVDCGTLPTLSNGQVELVESDSGYGAEANVVCNTGYDTNTSVVKCTANSTWQSSTCYKKDCGALFDITYGNATLDDLNDSFYGATASVFCDEGYEATKATITCLESGTWDSTECKLSGGNGHGENGKNGTGNTDGTKEQDGDFAPWKVAVIVLAVILAVGIFAGVILYVKCKNKQTVTPDKHNENILRKERSSEAVQSNVVLNTEIPSLSPRKSLPAITKQHEIKHGHVYIDHGDGHIFGLTIHLPFGKKPSNRLQPLNHDGTGKDTAE